MEKQEIINVLKDEEGNNIRSIACAAEYFGVLTPQLSDWLYNEGSPIDTTGKSIEGLIEHCPLIEG